MKHLLSKLCSIKRSARIDITIGIILFLGMAFILGGNVLVQAQPIKVQVSLGDVSLNKLPFVAAYEEGVYAKNGLDVEQFINPSAAEIIRRSVSMYPSSSFVRAQKGCRLQLEAVVR